MATVHKIKSAFRLSHGPLPMARQEIGAALDKRPEVYDMLTRRQLALVIDLLNIHWHKALAWKEADICAEGCVWDNRQQRLRDIA